MSLTAAEFITAVEMDDARATAQGLPPDAEDQSKKSQSTLIVEMIDAMNCELFHDEEQKAFITFPQAEHFETWPIRRKAFKNWVAHLFYLEHKKIPGTQGLQDALAVLEGKARYEGEQHEIFVRVGNYNDDVVIDLGNDSWNMIHIAANGWEIIPHGEVKFQRSSGMRPLPMPSSGSNARDLLSPFVNFTADDDWILFIGWLVSALNPNGPYLILELLGEQGSGKSTFMDLTRALIDANKASRRSEPRDPRDLMIAASNNRVVSLDNLSGLPAWLSDGLCRLSTGGAFGTRQLFTDDDETLFEAQRPIIMHGISAIASRPDLLDRSITLTLPAISSEKRGDERKFWESFHAVSGKILGALCDAVAGALAARSTTRLTSLERMADAVLWVTAAESALGWKPGAFQRAYQLNRADGDATALESSIVYSPLMQFMNKQTGESWEGTASGLLESLAIVVGESKARQKGWPTSPRSLRSALERIVPNLRNIGVTVILPKAKTQGQRNITISLDLERTRFSPSTSSTPSKTVVVQ